MHRWLLGLGAFALAMLGGCTDPLDIARLRWPLAANCTVDVIGKGTKDVETDYLPHVITCENGAASLEALKAQAIAARTFMYYKIALSGSVKDGTGDQVYTCASQPAQKHLDAVKATSGQVIVWSNIVICSFFVAGAKPTTASCQAAAGDLDPTSTEKFVTYNEGKSGSQVTQSTLGWVSPSNKYNRGCFSQNGSQCLALKGRPYPEMLRFYYGDDIQLETATGACVNPVSPDAGQVAPDSGPPPVGDGPPPVGDGPPASVDGSPATRDLLPAKRDLRPAKLDGRSRPRESGVPDFEADAPLPLRGGCAVATAGGERTPGLLLVLALGLAALVGRAALARRAARTRRRRHTARRVARTRRRRRTATLLGLLAAATMTLGAACGAGDGGPPETETPAHCNPLVGDQCLLPWPSSFYLQPDPATKTGYRVRYPQAALPRSQNDVALEPARYNLLDGFSVGSQLLVTFAAGVSTAGLPGPSDLAASVSEQSLVVVFDMQRGTRVPLFVELDANARPDEPAALIIRPQVPLAWNTRHAVLLRVGIKDRDGAALAPPAPFRRLRDGQGTKLATLEAQRARITEVLTFLEGQRVPRVEVLLAWDFHTASREAATGNVIGMVDDALARLPAAGPSFTITQAIDKEATEPHLLRQIEGTMSVPSYLAGDDADSWLKLDAAGRPVYRALQQFPFVVTIPRCAETASGPLPLLIYGHGIFGNPRDLFADPLKGIMQRLCVVAVATPWLGLSQADLSAILQSVIMDFSGLPRITDQLQQAHVNSQALVKLARGGLLQAPELQLAGRAVADGKAITYLGISNGGIQGTAFAALNRDIERHALHVAGGWWSMMIQRSSNFRPLAVMQERVYPRALDRLILVSLSQSLWDYTDPISFAGHVLREPLAGRAKKRVLLQESRWDDQVPNLATRAVVRGLGLALLATPVEKLYGLTEQTGPLDSAYAQWDLKIAPQPPTGNIPAEKPPDEGSAHHMLRRHDAALRQLEQFLRPDGRVVSPCDGACDPN